MANFSSAARINALTGLKLAGPKNFGLYVKSKGDLTKARAELFPTARAVMARLKEKTGREEMLQKFSGEIAVMPVTDAAAMLFTDAVYALPIPDGILFSLPGEDGRLQAKRILADPVAAPPTRYLLGSPDSIMWTSGISGAKAYQLAAIARLISSSQMPIQVAYNFLFPDHLPFLDQDVHVWSVRAKILCLMAPYTAMTLLSMSGGERSGHLDKVLEAHITYWLEDPLPAGKREEKR